MWTHSRKPLRLNGSWACVDCHDDLGKPTFGGRAVRPRLRCCDCQTARQIHKDWLSGRMNAAREVAAAIKFGGLPRPATLKCLDCPKQAECYDHRDYGRPLDVDPVCRSCNSRRGSAKPLNQIIVAALLLANAGLIHPS